MKFGSIDLPYKQWFEGDIVNAAPFEIVRPFELAVLSFFQEVSIGEKQEPGWIVTCTTNFLSIRLLHFF